MGSNSSSDSNPGHGIGLASGSVASSCQGPIADIDTVHGTFDMIIGGIDKMVSQHWVILELKQNQDQIAKWDPFLLHGYITFKAKNQRDERIAYFRVDWTSGGLRTPFKLNEHESQLESYIQGNENRLATGIKGVVAGAVVAGAEVSKAAGAKAVAAIAATTAADLAAAAEVLKDAVAAGNAWAALEGGAAIVTSAEVVVAETAAAEAAATAASASAAGTSAVVGCAIVIGVVVVVGGLSVTSNIQKHRASFQPSKRDLNELKDVLREIQDMGKLYDISSWNCNHFADFLFQKMQSGAKVPPAKQEEVWVLSDGGVQVPVRK